VSNAFAQQKNITNEKLSFQN